MSIGLVIGKFMPPHAGHRMLIDHARQRVDRLYAIVFSKSHEPIPGWLRAGWLRELYPEVTVHHVDRDHLVDYADPDAWEFWVGVIGATLPETPEVVFSSEPYGEELARRLGARHEAVDPERRRVPVSASQIRARPMAHWEYLPEPVRAYFARRVCVVGAESTGKTTLARALAAHFSTVWVPEYAREYLEANGNVAGREDFLHIARGQAESEDRLARQANRLLVGDTNLLTTQLWYEHYYGDCPEEIRRLAATRTAHLYFVCGLDVPWAPDALRDSPGQRQWFHDRFCQELAARGLPWVELSGPHEARLARAIGEVDRVLAA